MKQVLLSVGKRHDPALVTAIEDFTARLDREVDTSWHFIKPSGADEPTARRVESLAVLAYVKDDDFIVLCDERGQQLDSEALAVLYDGWLGRYQRIVWVIGGAYGVDEPLRRRANATIALSRLVFPHQLVRLVLVEQLYRARMITKNHPYHHS
jgi:23S rRNA (pseudouridine1915-N3)-methyltransferase